MPSDTITDSIVENTPRPEQAIASARGFRFESVDFGEVSDAVLSIWGQWQLGMAMRSPSVSYTHLTLPTICSV